MYHKDILEKNLPFVKIGDIGERLYDKKIRDCVERKTGERLRKLSNSKNYSHWNTFDWGRDFSLAELKYRPKLKYNSFPDTMIGYNKITEGLTRIRQGKRVFIFFAFIDGLYLWELTADNFKTDGRNLNYEEYWGKPYEGKDNDTTFDPNMKNFYIDIKKLIKV